MTQTTKSRAPRKAKKDEKRTIRVLVRPLGIGGTGAVRIATAKKTADYTLRELPVEFGAGVRGFSLAEIDGEEEYACRVSSDAAECECECLGFLRWSRCKHVSGLLALVSNDKL